MVKQDWMEYQIIHIEHARNEKNWSKKREQQFRSLLDVYHTGRFIHLSKKQIKQMLAN